MSEILTEDEFRAFVEGTTNTMPDWEQRVLAHDAALRAEVERLTKAINDDVYLRQAIEIGARDRQRAERAEAERDALKIDADIYMKALGHVSPDDTPERLSLGYTPKNVTAAMLQFDLEGTRAEIARLRAALEKIAARGCFNAAESGIRCDVLFHTREQACAECIAREALKKK